MSGEAAIQGPISELVEAIVDCGVDRFGSFLVVELWPADGRAFRVVSAAAEPATTVRTLADALGRVDVLGRKADVEAATIPAPGPPTLAPLLSADDQRRHGALLLGLAVPLFFLDSGGKAYPLVLRRLQRELDRRRPAAGGQRVQPWRSRQRAEHNGGRLRPCRRRSDGTKSTFVRWLQGNQRGWSSTSGPISP